MLGSTGTRRILTNGENKSKPRFAFSEKVFLSEIQRRKLLQNFKTHSLQYII